MFTGIIEEVGSLEEMRRGSSSVVLSIRAQKVLEGTRIGDSIAVNGICLTVTALHPGRFDACAMHETLNRTSLSGLHRGSRVNLERALALGGRLGGHIVAGHVDGTGRLLKMQRDGPAVLLQFQAAEALLRYIVEKGSVAIDGVSLTVAGVSRGAFTVSVIPHTLSQTTLVERRPGDAVNLDTDVIGKYVERFLLFPQNTAKSTQPQGSSITWEFLQQHGLA